MKRLHISLDVIAEYKNLHMAVHKAAKGKRYRSDIAVFLTNIDANLSILAQDIRSAGLPYGRYLSFRINDPKPRLIHAACFQDRVFHHALMNLAGPVLDRAMEPDSYACRKNKGVHKAVRQVQLNLRRYPCFVQIDIKGYFSSIDHELLLKLLMRRFKGLAIKSQFQRILKSYESMPAKGLPIGSLTSQFFANYFLDGLDRLLSADARVNAHVRYMDDVVWWCQDQQQAKNILFDVAHYLHTQRFLQIKPTTQMHFSKQGISYCGYRISPGALRLSRRRKRRYQQRRQFWEAQYLQGDINAQQLQEMYAAVHAITVGTDSLQWRRKNLIMHPPIEV